MFLPPPFHRDKNIAGEKIPWQMEFDFPGKRNGRPGDESTRRLFKYLTGGGIKHFTVTSEQMASAIRARRCVRVMLAIAALWMLFWLVPMPD